MAAFHDQKAMEEDFEIQMEACTDLNALVLYSSVNDIEYLSYGSGTMGARELYNFKKLIRNEFTEKLVSEESAGAWEFTARAGFLLLYKTIRYEDVWCTAVFDMDLVISRYEESIEPYSLFFVDQEGNTAGGTMGSQSRIIMSGQTVGPLEVGLDLQYSSLTGTGWIWAVILTGCSAILVALIIQVWRRMQTSVLHPVDILMRTMEEIREGKKEFGTGEDLSCHEFIQLDETFNSMMMQIKKLQIEQYEKELESQRFQMMYLQSQMRPHFYLNCLKNIYALAQKEQFEGIQNAIMTLSTHLRYVFSVNQIKIDLGQELDYLENYAELYRYNFSRLVLLSVDVPDELRGVQIPPVSLLTFMENSIRYANMSDKALKISVKARRIKLEGKECMNLTFRDNGEGFERKTLVLLNQGNLTHDRNGRVGIYNVVYRCRLLYPKGFYIYFMNEEGAVTDMYFPMDNPDQKSAEWRERDEIAGS